MNFGSLNREGGERRLNVALTRSRSEMLVFSTLDPDRIDLSRTQARAIADLKHFLHYAERGPAALAATVSGPAADFESPCETAVARAFRRKGWQVHPQVDVSKYRIDLGIVHPDEPGRYLAGIKCDGAMYHSSAVARERDKIRQQVLEGLGWTLFRIWSTTGGPTSPKPSKRWIRSYDSISKPTVNNGPYVLTPPDPASERQSRFLGELPANCPSPRRSETLSTIP